MPQDLLVNDKTESALLDQRLLREGWSLHRRLRAAASQHDPRNPYLLEIWRQVVAPDNTSNFDKRLEWDSLAAANAAWALDPPAEAVPQSPDWWPLLLAMRQAGRDAAAGVLAPHQLEGRGAQQPFVHAWRPVAAWALETLQQRCADLNIQLQLGEEAWLDLAEALLERLSKTADQALWELFNQRRTPGQMLLAHLGTNGDGSGEPVHEAYDTFMVELLSDGYAKLLDAYPVLGRLLAVATGLWLESSEEMLHRLAESRDLLEEHFAIRHDALLTSLQLGLSDPHRGGRAVAILRFGMGDDARQVVYKPKDMQVDEAYQHYLKTLNEASSLPPLYCLTIISRDRYGFMEFVDHQICKSDEELASFYANAGRILAVLHMLGCTDCHHENLIANGDQLVLIDTETLLEADLRDLVSDSGEGFSALQTSMMGSVLRSGLLPQWQMAGVGRKHAFDVSALGIQPPPMEFQMPGWLGINSDGMVAGRSSQPCELPTSLPVGLGSRQRLTAHVDELCTGFATQMNEILRLRPLLLNALDGFCGKLRRFVPRATRLYFTLQRQMLEPAALRNAVVHGLKLEQLSRSFVIAKKKPLNWPMFRAEILQMEQLDIPFFEHPIDGEELLLPDGLAPIPGLIKSSGLAAARRRFQKLDQAEINFQQQLIRGAIAARHLKTSQSTNSHETKSASDTDSATTSDYIDAESYRREAYSLGEEIWDAAIRDNQGRPEWLGMDFGGDGDSFRFGLIGTSLYSGSSGIALLFARLALASEGKVADQWRQRAWSCLEGVAGLADLQRNDQLFRLVRDQPFGIAGTGGMLLALALLERAGLHQAKPLAESLIDQLQPRGLLDDQGIDIILGVAGLIGPLLLHSHPRAKELAVLCGERLITLQLDDGSWAAGAMSNQGNLTGFSHGAAGMAAALSCLHKATHEKRFAESARHAIAYERSVFNPERNNWPDFTTTSDTTNFRSTWCHGAPGILMSRHVLWATGLMDEQITTELQAARNNTMAELESFASSRTADRAAHLCCGILGLSGLLRLDAYLTGQPLLPQVQNAESTLITRARAVGGYTLYSTDSGWINLPGLFTGKAGVALALIESLPGPHWMPAVLSAGLVDITKIY
jgi:type 2 lantibiotic biosynthesis protein LanM